MAIPLEDNAGDVISKAQMGLKISNTALAAAAGITREVLMAIKKGEPDVPALRAVAGPLALNADALHSLAQGNTRPAPVEVEGLLSFNTPFPIPSYAEMTVNAYLAYDPATRKAVAFDTGANASPIINALREHGLTLKLILLTHAHPDHIKDLLVLKNQTDAPPTFISPNEPISGAQALETAQVFNVGALTILALETPGHSPGGITYVVQGLARPLAIVGDAIFAGSMGGASNAWPEALRHIREKIMTLPPETILCPGHGPLTTVYEELLHNPYFAN